MKPGERLHKVLAAAGVASRRKVEQLIVEGRVSINGQIVRELGLRVNPRVDQLRVDGRLIEAENLGDHVYVLLHKPPGVVSTTDDERGRTTVLDLVPRYRSRRLVLAGRLDYHSEGLVLLTDDGALVHYLTHPSHHAARTYHAKVRGMPDEDALARLRDGVYLEDGKTQPAHVQILGPARVNTWVEITLTEGRNHQVRRMFEAVGCPVQRLIRVMLGTMSLDGLPPGASRELDPEEVRALRGVVDAPAPRRRSRAKVSAGRDSGTSGTTPRAASTAKGARAPRATREPATERGKPARAPHPSSRGKPDARDMRSTTRGKPETRSPRPPSRGKPDARDSRSTTRGKPEGKDSRGATRGTAPSPGGRPGSSRGGKPPAGKTSRPRGPRR
ncbi:MAG: pseudouridine synthase [Pseudomonadota bacterium]